jgi:hypothetical protein
LDRANFTATLTALSEAFPRNDLLDRSERIAARFFRFESELGQLGGVSIQFQASFIALFLHGILAQFEVGSENSANAACLLRWTLRTR